MTDQMKSEVTGIVKAVRKDGKGYKLDDDKWYSVYKGSVKGKRGDKVKLSVTIKEVGNNIYRDINKEEVLESSMTQTSGTFGDRSAEIILNNVNALVIKAMEKAEREKKEFDLTSVMQFTADIMTKTYLQIKNGLQSPPKEEVLEDVPM